MLIFQNITWLVAISGYNNIFLNTNEGGKKYFIGFQKGEKKKTRLINSNMYNGGCGQTFQYSNTSYLSSFSLSTLCKWFLRRGYVAILLISRGVSDQILNKRY